MMIIDEFKIWFEENKEKFVCKPYIYKNRIKNKRKKYIELRFENIIPDVYLYVNEEEIGLWADLEKIIEPGRNDLLQDFYVTENQNEEGKYYNGGHEEPKTYDTLKEVYYEELNGCFLPCINSVIREENFLAVSWNNGITSARIINPEWEPEIFESYKASSDKIGLPPTRREAILSSLVSIKNEKIISLSKKKNWHSKLLSLSLRKT